ncbi:hypothetical protein ACXC9Q_14625 [Kribbella sp. CWNU-51]
MTRELKTLMDRATDRPAPFTPDPATLVAAGRRQVRNRRITGSLAALAAVVVLAAGATVAVDLQGPHGVAPATQDRKPRSTPSPVGSVKLCTASNGAVYAYEAWAWPEVVSISDQYGSASIRREPTATRYRYTARYAFCTTQRANALRVPLGSRGGVIVRKSPIDSGHSVTTVFGRAYGNPQKVVVQTGDGQNGEATIKSEFYVYRHVEPQPWPGREPMVVATTIGPTGSVTSVGRW